LYVFLKDPLVRRFGQEWYDELCAVAVAVAGLAVLGAVGHVLVEALAYADGLMPTCCLKYLPRKLWLGKCSSS
jgi:hypothetical protein